MEACGAVCCRHIWMRFIVEAYGVVLLWRHMAARRFIVEACGVICLEAYEGGWPWMHVE